MSTVRQRAPRLQFPSLPAEHNQHGDPVEADFHDGGHCTQPVLVLGDIAIFDGRPV